MKRIGATAKWIQLLFIWVFCLVPFSFLFAWCAQLTKLDRVATDVAGVINFPFFFLIALLEEVEFSRRMFDFTVAYNALIIYSELYALVFLLCVHKMIRVVTGLDD